ncbi:hypothetical protein ACWGI8_03505 [Streptomyces sp. NPDC054841]
MIGPGAGGAVGGGSTERRARVIEACIALANASSTAGYRPGLRPATAGTPDPADAPDPPA